MVILVDDLDDELIFEQMQPGVLREKFGIVARVLENKYGFDELYQKLFGDGAVKVGTGLWRGGDVTVIDGVLVNGSARTVGAFGPVRMETVG